MKLNKNLIMILCFFLFNCNKNIDKNKVQVEKFIRKIHTYMEYEKYRETYSLSLKIIPYDLFRNILKAVYVDNGKLLFRKQIGYHYYFKKELFRFGNKRNLKQKNYDFVYEAVYLLTFENLKLEEYIYIAKEASKYKLLRIDYKPFDRINKYKYGVDGRQNLTFEQRKEVEKYRELLIFSVTNEYFDRFK